VKQIQFNLVKTAYALIWTEGGRGPFAVLTAKELADYLTLYRERKIKTHVFIKSKEK
jgi:hypothetical protein